MADHPLSITAPAEVRRIACSFPSFRDFVDDALFHPAWGYYSTGNVRFGEGGHYDTFPLSLSPLFGRMLVEYAYRVWRRAGKPAEIELCEIGAGNGQLCLDVIIWTYEQARHGRSWTRFARALRYRIIERSPALIARQKEKLGALSPHVTWTQADLAERAARGVPFAPCGLVFANEVLDCLAHHKVVRQPGGTPGAVFVVPTVVGQGVESSSVPRKQLARALGDQRLRDRMQFREVVLPLHVVPGLRPFVRRHYPEFFEPRRRFKPYFACPAIEVLIRNAARLYRSGEMLWIDYGEWRDFHLKAREENRVFAGPPKSGASVYRAPGHDDITFLVDFSVVAAAAEAAGLRVKFYGPQVELARRSGVVFDRRARDLILRYRMLGWMLALVGIGPERAWRNTSLTWDPDAAQGGSMRNDVNRAVAELLGKRSSNFKLMILG
ncbi:MAG TPA: SAM-dependent methyltransferase [Candidatus Acidoferrales bacterium]|nr:SAM-dependent methyltransferase [Candidatus Acidoferrales bacterium]